MFFVPSSTAIFAAFDSVATDRDGLEIAIRALSDEAATLAAGTPSAARGAQLPPGDNLILGPDPDPDNLTITVALGASLFDDRFGLAALKPVQLQTMPGFPNDKPDPDQMHGDLLVQLCASTPESAVHALRRLMRATRDALVLRWMMPGFNRPNTLGKGRTSTRNLLGFKDGTANLDTTDSALMDRHVWVQPGDGEPEWAVGGTYQVMRLIRLRVEFWDRTALQTQEQIMGRHKDSGAPLGGAGEADLPDFSGVTPTGAPLFRPEAHIRLANPRTPETQRNLILRRGFSYSRGFDRSGQLDQGLAYVSFQRSHKDGFLAVQARLNGEALEEYITPFGGGFFFAPPGAMDPSSWLAQDLFTTSH